MSEASWRPGQTFMFPPPPLPSPDLGCNQPCPGLLLYFFTPLQRCVRGFRFDAQDRKPSTELNKPGSALSVGLSCFASPFNGSLSTIDDVIEVLTNCGGERPLRHSSVAVVFSERELTFTFPICYRPSVCRLSVVCNVRAPYSGGSDFRHYFYGIR